MPDRTEELIQIRQALKAVRDSVNQNLDALAQQVESLIPDIPDNQEITDWRREVKRWKNTA